MLVKFKHIIYIWLVSLVSYATPGYAELSKFEQCQLRQMKRVNDNLDVAQINQICAQIEALEKASSNGALSERLEQERKTAFSPYVITPHRMNYILAASYTTGYNEQAYEGSTLIDPKQQLEAKMQLSFKVPLNYAPIFKYGDGLFFGMTMQSWWQVYSSLYSKPFRETNYQPEVFYFLPTKWQLFNTTTNLAIGLEHQSNGRELPLSRSWNRLYLAVLVEHQDWVLNFRPWWRLPENAKKSIDDPNGDDNPDIDKYMGHWELSGAYRIDKNLQSQFLMRYNFNSGRGSIEAGVTFPIWGRLRGYVQAYSGYGESLIDYNHSQQRLSLGIALTDLL
ncbi:phospholipase A [Catenovulum sp. SX2]|uniref:phospholipase A n=1 Tax=Catenovulum sp. SX2 TaxID=3398614 RepID=UPI003F826027